MLIYKIGYVAADAEWSARVDANRYADDVAKDFIKYADATREGTYKLLGWVYDFRDDLKRYVVKIKHYGWIEYYASNRTRLRKALGSHNIIKILEYTEG